MLSFSNNPQDFIQDWLKSQSRDLKVPAVPFPPGGGAGRAGWSRPCKPPQMPRVLFGN